MSDLCGGGPVVAVVGPTATGKSDLGIELAVRLGGAVVNADAMQLYKGMDIGTAKVPPAQRRGVAHYQLDVLEVTQEASVAAYQRVARADLDEAARLGLVPIVVGGSGLYVRALLDRIDFPPTDAAVRARIEQRATRLGTGTLYDELLRADPAAAAAIEPANTRRIVRALEVIELTGRPFTATLPRQEYVRPTIQLGLRADFADLDRRIETRVEAMFDAGLVEEVRTLLDQGLAQGVTASRAVGYSQVIELLAGRATMADTRAAIALATRQLARRQFKWFRRDTRIIWLDAADPHVVDHALGAVAKAQAQ